MRAEGAIFKPFNISFDRHVEPPMRSSELLRMQACYEIHWVIHHFSPLNAFMIFLFDIHFEKYQTESIHWQTEYS
jgi:hypothetical protein